MNIQILFSFYLIVYVPTCNEHVCIKTTPWVNDKFEIQNLGGPQQKYIM